MESYVTADGRSIGNTLMDMRNITLRFGGVEAIKQISFDIREGEIRAIIGPNGAGKSSMLNVISGFYNPQEGEVWFKGEKCDAAIYDRAQMKAGAEFTGPAIVEQIDSTVVVPPKATAKVDQYMNILIRVKD